VDVEAKLRVLADAAKLRRVVRRQRSKRARVEGGIGNITGNGICHSLHARRALRFAAQTAADELLQLRCSYCVNRIRQRYAPGGGAGADGA